MRTDVGVSSDPLTDALTQVLTVPLRELYAVLWRLGVIEIVG
ncbi:Rv1535 domain-containing protein [Nocardia sp. NBC_00508]|nr:Rv1535 domain-containing protein [Nocardia sp. NBC_00508]WUD70197.1 Rv1535 domain-containing protein [Nocardia sp. NBC_00508]